MTIIVAVTGFSGAGKTTALQQFERQGVGQRIYLGKIVLDEISARNLAVSPSNERLVRLELREKEGPAVLAVRASPAIERCLDAGTNIFIDAIFDIEEYQFLTNRFTNCPLVLLGIQASFEIRSLRVATRAERPITREELKIRDETELSRLKTGNVMNHANYRIDNESTLAMFQEALEQFWKSITT